MMAATAPNKLEFPAKQLVVKVCESLCFVCGNFKVDDPIIAHNSSVKGKLCGIARAMAPGWRETGNAHAKF